MRHKVENKEQKNNKIWNKNEIAKISFNYLSDCWY